MSTEYGPLKWELFYYDSAAESFHTKKLCSRLYSTEIEFNLKKNKNRLLSPFEKFGGLRGNYAL